MYAPFMAMGVATALLSGLMAWAVARRYGWKPALAVPGLALLALIMMLWRASLLTFQDGIGVTAAAVVLAAPTVMGALLGIVIAVRR